MPRILFATAAILCLLASGNSAFAFVRSGSVKICHVALDGDDHWSGNLAKPNSTHTDGPYRTIDHALDAAREEISAADSSISTVDIRLGGGLYSLAKPIALGPDDGAAASKQLTIEADGGAAPILSGGTRVTGWKNVGGDRWEATLPDVAAGQWYFSQLYIDGRRRYRPRLPRRGFYYVASEVAPSPKAAGKGFDRFRYKAGDIDPAWSNRDDIEVLPFQVWNMARLHIAGIDPAQRVVTFTGMIQGNSAWSHIGTGRRYLIENVKEALSQPGEWYLDRKTGVLTYLALPGENPNRDEVIAPRIEQLVQIDGAANVTLRGLTLADSAWNLAPDGGNFPQSSITVPAAVTLTHCQNVTLQDCTVRNTGNYAVEFGAGARHCTLDHCLLYDLGGGGVKIGTSAFEADAAKEASSNTVEDCRIVGGGRIHPASAGIWVGQSSGNTIAHNEIADLYQIGISLGYTWGYGQSGAHDNVVTYNDIHRIGQGVLSDMGGIYTLGVSPGTILDHNRISEVHPFDYGGWGIYFDEGSSGISATNNVAFHCKSSPFTQHYGTDNVLENNILALGGQGQLNYVNANNGAHVPPDRNHSPSFTIKNNIVFADGEPLFVPDWSSTSPVLEDNVYWDSVAKGALRFPGDKTLAAWQAGGQDAGSIVADPLFANPEKGDFSLPPGSPASRGGFAPIDLSSVGPRGLPPFNDDLPRAFPTAAIRPIRDDCEEYAPGDEPGAPLRTAWADPGAAVVVEGPNAPQASIRVTDETACTGKQSIKFTDPGSRTHQGPNLYYKAQLSQSTAVGCFALRVEKGAVIDQEWRDDAKPYNVGPSLRIGPDGALTASGRDLAKLPLDTWIRFTVTCPLGARANGAFDLLVQPVGSEAPLRFTDLPCGSGTTFRHVNWWGFTSDSAAPSVFYLDDLSLQQLPAKPSK